MTPTLLEGPAAEPVSLAAMKAYLRISAGDEDAVLGELIAAARAAVETAAGCFLVAQRWRIAIDRWPRDGIVPLPLGPVISCDAVRVAIASGGFVAAAPSLAYVDAFARPARLVLVEPPPAPARARGGIEIDLTVGYGASPEAAPATLRHAVRLLAARWFERRGDEAADAGAAGLPAEIMALIGPSRPPRL